MPAACRPPPAALSHIRNLPQHRRPFRPRGRRHIRRPPVPSLVSQHGKRHRLLGLRRQPELIGESQLGLPAAPGTPPACATSVAFRRRPRKESFRRNVFFAALDFGITNRRTASAIDRAVSAVAVATTSCLRARPHRRKNSRTNSRPNSSRPAVFGGFARKNLRFSSSARTDSIDLSRCRNLPTTIERPAKQRLRHRIDHHIPRPGIESEYSLSARARRNRREIRDPSNVLHNPPNLRIAKKQVVKIRNQRRTLAARRHVRRTKIRNHRHAHPRRNHGALARLPGRGNLASQKTSAPLPGGKASAHGTRPDPPSPETAAPSPAPRPHTTRPKEN